MPLPLVARTLCVSIAASVVLVFAQDFSQIYLPWWAQLLMSWPAGRIAIAWYRRRHPWPY
jgi:hypothetical protein